jgi:hypothetical protein
LLPPCLCRLTVSAPRRLWRMCGHPPRVACRDGEHKQDGACFWNYFEGAFPASAVEQVEQASRPRGGGFCECQSDAKAKKSDIVNKRGFRNGSVVWASRTPCLFLRAPFLLVLGQEAGRQSALLLFPSRALIAFLPCSSENESKYHLLAMA